MLHAGCWYRQIGDLVVSAAASPTGSGLGAGLGVVRASVVGRDVISSVRHRVGCGVWCVYVADNL